MKNNNFKITYNSKLRNFVTLNNLKLLRMGNNLRQMIYLKDKNPHYMCSNWRHIPENNKTSSKTKQNRSYEV